MRYWPLIFLLSAQQEAISKLSRIREQNIHFWSCWVTTRKGLMNSKEVNKSNRLDICDKGVIDYANRYNLQYWRD